MPKDDGGIFGKPGDYDTRDLAFYTGLFAGIIAVYVGLGFYGVPDIVRLIGGVLFGLAAGAGCQKAYERMTFTRDDGPGDDKDLATWRCSRCGTEVSVRRDECPQCGHSEKL